MTQGKIYLLFATALLFALPPSEGRAQEISRTPPPVFAAEIESRLTPLKELLEMPSPMKDEGDDSDFGGVVLASEVFNHIDAEGRRTLVLHNVYRAMTEGGAESIGEDVFHYRQRTQRIHLVEAQTISPDGKKTPIRDNAAIIRIPQRDAEASLYSDDADLVIVFPNVKPGTVTQTVVVIEEDEFPMPGEFSARYTWGARWPVALKRWSIELPPAMAERAQVLRSGRAAPQTERDKLDGGRVRWEWARRGIPGELWEPSAPPAAFTDPVTWFTTLRDWDALAAWYTELTAKRGTLDDGLKTEVDRWTADIEGRDAVVAALFDKVANDVRYTGMEFGRAGLQPYDCNEVWKNQYGDCKDKANLLRAMLAHKGIPSHLTLVNTKHLGQVERRSPSHRQFNHAILAVEKPDGGLLFCDPTVDHGAPGLLAPGDSGREVLVIDDGQARWVRTPAQRAGTIRYEFDLTLSGDGSLAGWMKLSADGYYATSFASDYLKRSHAAALAGTRELAQNFFPAAAAIDVEVGEAPKSGGEFTLRCYFEVPSAGGEGGAVPFPISDSIQLDLDDSKPRQTPYGMWTDTMAASMTLNVPDGWLPGALPTPYAVETGALVANASWSGPDEEGRFVAEVEIDYPQRSIAPGEFKAVANAARSLRRWTGRRLTFAPADGQPAPPAPVAVTLENFPMMATGSGQLDLLDRRFPGGGNARLREAALRRAIEYFSDDEWTVFTARAKLALLDWNAERHDEAAGKFEALLKESDGKVSESDLAWGRYLLGLAQRDGSKPETAELTFFAIWKDGAVDEDRRGWAAYQAAEMIAGSGEERRLPTAYQLAVEALELTSDARPYCVYVMARVAHQVGMSEDLATRLRGMAEDNDDQLEQIVARVVAAAGEIEPEGARSLAEMLSVLPTGDDTELSQSIAENVATLEGKLALAGVCVAIASGLESLLGEIADDAWQNDAPPEKLLTDAAAFEARCDELLEAGDLGGGIRHVAELLIRQPDNVNFAYYHWRLTDFVDLAENGGDPVLGGKLLPFLIAAIDRLPRTNDFFWDGKFLHARHYERRDQRQKELALFRTMEKAEDLPESFENSLHERLAVCLNALGKHEEALDYFARGEGRLHDPDACDGVVRAALLCLELGQRSEGLRRLRLLKDIDEERVAEMGLAVAARYLRAALDDEKTLLANWKGARAWWGDWVKFRKRYGVDQPKRHVLVDVVENETEAGQQIGIAFARPDREGLGEELDAFAHGARWVPEWAGQLGHVLYNLGGQCGTPGEANAFRRMAETVLEGVVGGTPTLLRPAQFWRTAALLDLGDNDDALEVIDAFRDADAEPDGISLAMIRLRAIAAKAIDDEDLLRDVAGELSAALDDPESADRPLNVASLATVYQSLGDHKSEETLLKRELEHPDIRADEARLAHFEQRYAALSEGGAASDDFTAAAGRWLDKNRPSWWGYVLPEGLDDPRAKDLTGALDDPSAFSPAESIKLSLLAATESSLPLPAKTLAFRSAVFELASHTRTFTASRKLFDTALEEEDLGANTRAILRYFACTDANKSWAASELKRYLDLPDPEPDNAHIEGLLQVYHQFAKKGFTKPDEAAARIRDLAREPVTNFTSGAITDMFNRLAAYGDHQRMEAARKEASQWTMDPAAGGSLTSLKLQLMRMTKSIRKGEPLRKAVEALVAEHLPPSEFPSEPRADLKISASIGAMAPEKALAWRLNDLREGRWALGNVSACIDLIELVSFSFPDKRRSLGLPIFAAILEHADDDRERSMSIAETTGLFDIDDREFTERLWELFAPYRDAGDYPFSAEAIRYVEAATKFRWGSDADLRPAFKRIDHPDLTERAQFKLATYLHHEGRRDELVQALESLDSDVLLGRLSTALELLPAAGLEDMAELAREEAEQFVREAVASTWLEDNPLRASYPILIARLCDRPDWIPKEFVSEMLDLTANPHVRLTLACGDARLRKDWARLLENAEVANEKLPTYYHYHLHRALALSELDRGPEAIPHLETYVRYANDEPDHPAAKRLLTELKRANGTAP